MTRIERITRECLSWQADYYTTCYDLKAITEEDYWYSLDFDFDEQRSIIENNNK